MATATQSNDVSGVTLTKRQREVWEMTHGLGEFQDKGPQKAQEIADALGISANAVYVTRRRVRQILENSGIGGGGSLRAPKRIIRSTGNNLEDAKASLRAEYEGYEAETEALKARLEEIETRKPEVKETLDRLEALTAPASQPEGDLVAA